MGQAQLLPEPVTTKITNKYENTFFKVASSCMQGWRINMEDAHTIILSLENDKDTAYFGVFDGHGGAVFSNYAAAHLHNKIFNQDSFRTNIEEAIQNGFIELDEELSKDESMKKLLCGTTALCTIIKDKKLYCGNAGDSRAIASVNGQLVNLSSDHKPFVESELKRIRAAGGWVESNRVNGRITLTRALGDFQFKKNKSLKINEQILIALPDVNTKELSEDYEFIVMACDGVWDVLNSEKVLEFVRTRIAQSILPEDICEELIMSCLAPSNTLDDLGCDNMTVVLICFLHGDSYQKLVKKCQVHPKIANKKKQSLFKNIFQRVILKHHN